MVLSPLKKSAHGVRFTTKQPGDHPYITSAKRMGGWVGGWDQKNGNFG